LARLFLRKLSSVHTEVAGKLYHLFATFFVLITSQALNCSFLSYGTKCVPEMFAPINRQWTASPYTEIRGLYLAGSDAFLPSVTGAMYGGAMSACAVLGKVGTLRLGHAILSHLAKRLRDDDPKLSRVEAYILAIKKFIGE